MTNAQRLFADIEGHACPRCEAEPGDDCINTLTGDVLPVPHWQRVKAAEEAQ